MSKGYPKQYEIWIVDLEPALGSEPGKLRPVIIVQSDLLNSKEHKSTIVCAISSQYREGISFIRIPVIPSVGNGLKKTSYILCDQIRSVDLSRLKGKIGMLDSKTATQLNETLTVILTP
jgi:mRNA interferase MazF